MREYKDILNDLDHIFLMKDKEIFDLKQQLKKEFHDVYDHLAFRIVKKILFFIEKGINENQAIMLVFDELSDQITLENLQMIWKNYRPKKSGLLLYARCYTAKKMFSAGYTLTDISKVLGVSITTISKLVKKTILE